MTEESTQAARTPRWIKVFGIVALVVIVLVVVLLIAGRGGHGPSRHASGVETSDAHSGPPPGAVHEQP